MAQVGIAWILSKEGKPSPLLDKIATLELTGKCSRCDCAHRRHHQSSELARYYRLVTFLTFTLGIFHGIHGCILGAVHVKLTDEEIKYLEEVYKPQAIIGHT